MTNPDLPASRVAAVFSFAALMLWTAQPATAGALAPSGLASLPTDTIEVANNPLESASLGFARALETGAPEDLSSFLGSGGIRLHLNGPGHAGLSVRQAVAALREFLRRYDGGTTVVSRAAPVEGSQDRGFAEVFWSARASGTSDEVHRTLFLGFYLEGDDWRIEEVRVLR